MGLKEQVVFLLSRNSFVKYIMFIGNKKETSKILRDIIKKRSPFSVYINNIVQTFHNESLREYETNLKSPVSFDISKIPF